MSLDVKLEPDDRKFIKEAKGAWQYAKKQMVWLAVAMAVGFGLGKLYTWDTTIADCRVLGSFRIANTAFQCKMLAP